MYSSLLKNNNFISQQNNKSNGETKSLEELERIVMEKAQFNHRLNIVTLGKVTLKEQKNSRKTQQKKPKMQK